MTMLKIRITGFTAIEVAERLGVTLTRANHPEGGNRDGLWPRGARLTVEALGPSSVFLELPAPGFVIPVDSRQVWLIHPDYGWIEMPLRNDLRKILPHDLEQDCMLRRLSDREVRDLGQGFIQTYCSTGCDRAAGPCCDLCGECRAAEASLGRACCVLAENASAQVDSNPTTCMVTT